MSKDRTTRSRSRRRTGTLLVRLLSVLIMSAVPQSPALAGSAAKRASKPARAPIPLPDPARFQLGLAVGASYFGFQQTHRASGTGISSRFAVVRMAGDAELRVGGNGAVFGELGVAQAGISGQSGTPFEIQRSSVMLVSAALGGRICWNLGSGPQLCPALALGYETIPALDFVGNSKLALVPRPDLQLVPSMAARSMLAGMHVEAVFAFAHGLGVIDSPSGTWAGSEGARASIAAEIDVSDGIALRLGLAGTARSSRFASQRDEWNQSATELGASLGVRLMLDGRGP